MANEVESKKATSGSKSDTTGQAAATNMTSFLPTNDILDERLIDAEYKIWKKNTPYLYDFVLTHSLEWPSLTCQWLPQIKTLKNNTSTIEHQLLLGTHTTDDEPNYLMIASCLLPYDDRVIPAVDATATNATAAMSSASTNKENGSTNNNNPTTKSTPTSGKEPTTVDSTNTTVASLRYDEDKKEIGGYGLAGSGSGVGKIEIKMKILHEGEVNRARYMPQNHFIVATRGPNPELYIWDVSKHTSFPTDKSKIHPQAICVGHEKEGYAMSWSPHTSNLLCSGSEDMTVKLWDISSVQTQSSSGSSSKGTRVQITAQSTFECHTATVEDVAFHCKDSNMIGSVGDDCRICIWDTRSPDKPIHNIVKAHESDINCIAFNPQLEYIIATGCADSTIAVWDLRNMSKPTSQLLGHNDQVFKLEWSPFNESILGSCSADRRVALWDLSRIGQEQSAEDAEDGPPELLFIHGGHTNKVSDFSWNANDQWSLVSVSEDNVLQVWKPAEEIYAEEDDDDEDNDDLEDDGNGNVKIAKITVNETDLE